MKVPRGNDCCASCFPKHNNSRHDRLLLKHQQLMPQSLQGVVQIVQLCIVQLCSCALCSCAVAVRPVWSVFCGRPSYIVCELRELCCGGGHSLCTAVCVCVCVCVCVRCVCGMCVVCVVCSVYVFGVCVWCMCVCVYVLCVCGVCVFVCMCYVWCVYVCDVLCVWCVYVCVV